MDQFSWSGIDVIDASDAADFLARLDPSHDLWRPFEYERWIFRGQADARWDLIPRAFRSGERSTFSFPELDSEGAIQAQIRVEAELLAKFVRLTDELGLALPGDLHTLRREPAGLFWPWPPSGCEEAVAVAQHHGVPTRLLDLTFNSNAAAFFAASEHRTATKLAVWAIDGHAIEQLWNHSEPGLRVVRVSGAAHPFVRAQRGLFLFNADPNAMARPSLREIIVDRVQGASAAVVGPVIRCVTLPVSHRKELLDRLAARRVTRAHLMPTLDNVVAQLGWVERLCEGCGDRIAP